MAQFSIRGVQIQGITTCTPGESQSNRKLAAQFPPEEVEKIIKMTGVESRYIGPESICTSDLCEKAARHLIQKLNWDPASIDALIFVSQTPDYKLPATSCVLQNRLGLSTQTACFDMNLGCSGYVYGLWTGAGLLRADGPKRALILVGDTIHRNVDVKDRSTFLLFGDAGSATALEWTGTDTPLNFVLGSDGAGEKNLIIPRGAARGTEQESPYLYMEGGEIFNFTCRVIPQMLDQTLKLAGQGADSVDRFVFHQANLFILNHLGKKLKLPSDRVPLSVKNFGNTSSASIPITLTTQQPEFYTQAERNIFLCGFGVGYSWGSVQTRLTPLKECSWIPY